MEKIKQLIENSKTILILTHINPDGDAIGSSLALYNSLIKIHKKVDIIIKDIPKTFNFLPNFDKIKTNTNTLKYDLIIIVDCADYKRIEQSNNNYFANAKYTLNIDHHVSNTKYANYNYISSNSPACCEYLVEILDYLKFDITKEIAECLMTGILTDTGGFQYTNVSEKTYNFASRVSKLIDISKIYKKVLSTQTRAQFELAKIAISRIEFYLDDKIALTYLKMKDFTKVNASYGDHDGIVNIARNISGVEISIFIREVLNGYRISLRGNGNINVNEIATVFGGGGHKDAAGFDSKLKLNELKQKLLKTIRGKI